MHEKKETVMLSQQQVGQLFSVQKAAVSKHANNIFKSGELNKKSTVSILETVQNEGNRKIIRKITYYNLDLILSIGYRVNSSSATKFRQWATKTLREYIIKGYAINPKSIKTHYVEFMAAVADIKTLLPANNAVDSANVLELISAFAETWLSLEAYDKDELTTKGVTKRSVSLTATQLSSALAEFKATLIIKGMASELFGLERNQGSVAGIVGNVMQSFGGQAVYPTIEEKAAHLLYFIIKNHHFADGNKRSGAYAFVWFLQKAKLLDRNKLTPPALTALTLLIAESAPKHKERMVNLVLRLLKK